MIVSRRSVLAAGLAAAGLQRKTIRFSLAPDAGAHLSAGVRFGAQEAARAATLLGYELQQSAAAPVAIRKDATLLVHGIAFSLRAPADSYLAARRSAGFPRSVPDIAAVEWHHSLERYGASELNARFVSETGARMSADHWLGWMAVKVIAESAFRAREGEALDAAMRQARFDGHKGVALRFDAARHLPQPLYVVNLTTGKVLWQG